MKTLKAIFSLIIIVLIVVAVVFLYYQFANLAPGSFQLGRPQSTPNLTAGANWTPTPDSPNQASNLIATAWPTPVTRVIEADREAFRQAFLEKLTARSINWSLLSSLNHAGVAWRCSDLKLGVLSLPGSTSGSLVAVWSAWYGGLDNSTMQITVTNGSLAPAINNLEANTLDIYQNALVNITFPDFGIVGPEIQQGNEVALVVDEPSLLYGLWITPREWLTGEDLLTQKEVDNLNLALDWAKIDSIAPLRPDGNRDSAYLDLLYNMAAGTLDPSVNSVIMPDGSTATLDHSLYNQLLAIANEAAVKAGYAGVETLIVSVNRPQNLGEYHYLANREVPIVPPDISVEMTSSTCQQVQISPETLAGLSSANLTKPALDDIVSRLLEALP